MRLGQLEELGCTSESSSSGQRGMGMLFPPARVCSGGLSDVRAFFAADAVDIDLKGAGVGAEDVADLGDALEKVVVRSIDMSDNGALGTSGAARVLEWVGRGVKSVSMKGTGLGLAAGQGSLQQGQQRLLCSGEEWTRLEGALRGLAALEVMDLSENGALGASGVGRLVSCCAGEAFACVMFLCACLRVCDVVVQGACGGCRFVGARGFCLRV